MDKKKRLNKEEMEQLLFTIEEKQLLHWYERWKDQPWNYALTTSLIRLPVLLLFFMLFNLQLIKKLFAHPVQFVSERWGYLLIYFLLMLIVQRITWNRTAYKYYQHLQAGGGLPRPDPDSVIMIRGRKNDSMLPVRYQRWGQRKGWLILLFMIGLPLVFHILFYFATRFKEGNWSWADYYSIYDPYVFEMVTGIFMVFGILIGWGIWREIRDQFNLLQKSRA